MSRRSLTEIAYAIECFKGANGYTLVYEPFFAPRRGQKGLEILELGLAAGGPELGGDQDRVVARAPSIELWLDYFVDAHVTGFDISDFSGFAGDRFTFIRGDSGNVDDLKRIEAAGRRFDIIIDDASHASFHQQIMLGKLFRLLKPGGLYIIEDLNWVPEDYERSLPAVGRTRDVLVAFLRSGTLATSTAITPDEAASIERQVAGLFLFDHGYINANKRRYCQQNDLKYRFSGPGTAWRNKAGLARMIDLYFWRYMMRTWAYGFRGEEFCARDYIHLAILHRK